MTVDLRVSGVHLDHRDARNSVSDIRGCQKRCKNYLFIANRGKVLCVGVLTDLVGASVLVACYSGVVVLLMQIVMQYHSTQKDSNGDKVLTANAQNSSRS